MAKKNVTIFHDHAMPKDASRVAAILRFHAVERRDDSDGLAAIFEAIERADVVIVLLPGAHAQAYNAACAYIFGLCAAIGSDVIAVGDALPINGEALNIEIIPSPDALPDMLEMKRPQREPLIPRDLIAAAAIEQRAVENYGTEPRLYTAQANLGDEDTEIENVARLAFGETVIIAEGSSGEPLAIFALPHVRCVYLKPAESADAD